MTVSERKRLCKRVEELEAQLQASKELFAEQTKELVSAKAQILELQEVLNKLEHAYQYLSDEHEVLLQERN